jgi:hypothetical protein
MFWKNLLHEALRNMPLFSPVDGVPMFLEKPAVGDIPEYACM